MTVQHKPDLAFQFYLLEATTQPLAMSLQGTQSLEHLDLFVMTSGTEMM